MKTESKLFTSWNNINNLRFNKKLKENSTRFLRDIFCSGTAGNCCLLKDKTKKVYFSLWSGGLLAAFLVLWRLVWSWETTLNHFVSSAPKSLYYGKELQSYKVFEEFQSKYVPIFKPSTVLVMKQVTCCYTIDSTTQVNDNLQNTAICFDFVTPSFCTLELWDQIWILYELSARHNKSSQHILHVYSFI